MAAQELEISILVKIATCSVNPAQIIALILDRHPGRRGRWTESPNIPNRALDAVNSLGATVEKVVVYATLPSAFAKVIVHGTTLGYF